MSKILVLGSEGQIGNNLTSKLKKDKNNEIIECDIACHESHDLRVKSKYLDEVFKNSDFVYFLAYDVGGSTYLNKNQNSNDFIDNNLMIMKNTFSYLEKYKIPFIFASTQMSNMTHSPYGTLKRIGEFYTNNLGGHVVRLWNIYGIENDPAKTHVITDFINSAIKDQSIKIKTTGQEQRQFLHADDCSRALIKIQQNFELIEKRYLDISSFKWSTIYEVAKIVSGFFDNIPVKRGPLEDIVQNKIIIQPDPYFTKFWSPEITLEKGIKNIIDTMVNKSFK